MKVSDGREGLSPRVYVGWIVDRAEHPVPFVLNVEGPRESKARGIQKRTRKFLAEVLGGMLSLIEKMKTLIWCIIAFVKILI